MNARDVEEIARGLVSRGLLRETGRDRLGNATYEVTEAGEEALTIRELASARLVFDRDYVLRLAPAPPADPWVTQFEAAAQAVARGQLDLAALATPSDPTRCQATLGEIRCALEDGHRGHLHHGGRRDDGGTFVSASWPVACPLCGKGLRQGESLAHERCAAREGWEADR